MARWRLTQPHYLIVPGTEWEYRETDRASGKQGRKNFPVPLYLNPEYAGDCNYPGEVVVCHEGKGSRNDIVFIGPPTPDMEPLDEEAENISGVLQAQWKHPIDTLPGQGYSQSLLDEFERQIAQIVSRETSAPAPNVSMAGVSQEKFDQLQAQVAALVEQNAKLMEQLQEKSSRRI